MYLYIQNTAEISEGQEKTERLINTLAWFFFKLLIYGYVEDLKTGMAFRLPGGLSWKLFVEVFKLKQHTHNVINRRNYIGYLEV